MRKVSIAAFLLCLLSPPLHAQKPVTEKIEVRLLELDVIVTDKDGKPVSGLTPDDLVLVENGSRQEITNLSEYREQEATATSDVPGAPAPARAFSRPEPRMLVLLFDRIPLRGQARTNFFDSLLLLVDKTMRTGDRARILEWTRSGFKTSLDVSSDASVVKTAISKIAKRPTAVAGGVSIEEETTFFETAEALSGGAGISAAEQIATSKRNSAEEDLAEMRRKTASMQRLVSSLTSTTSRTLVVYVSDHFSRIAGMRAFTGKRSLGGFGNSDQLSYDTTEMIASVVRSANANGISFYAIRPEIPSSAGGFGSIAEEQAIASSTLGGGTEAIADHVIWQNELQALTHLAEQTGGTVGAGPQGTLSLIDRISSDLGSYYSVGWRASSDGSDRERRVRVRAKNMAYRVRTRTALVEKSDRTRATDQLIARLFEQGSSGDLEFEVTAGAPTMVRSARTTIPVELTIPVDQLKFVQEGNELAARFTVFTVAGPNIGQTSKITNDTRRLVSTDGGTEGVARYKFELIADLKPTTVAVGVYDENAALLGVRTIELQKGHATVPLPDLSDPVAGAAWKESQDRAARERKPLLAFFRPKRCRPCEPFVAETVRHPTIERRLSQLVFVTLPMAAAEMAQLWPSKEPGLALFDADRNLRARWIGVPDTTTLGTILDSSTVSAANFERAAQLSQADPQGGQIEVAMGLMKLGRPVEARATLEEVIASGQTETSQLAMVVRSFLDVREGKSTHAVQSLHALIAQARTPKVAAEAWMALGTIHRALGANDEATRALQQAIEASEPDSPVVATANSILTSLRGSARSPAGVIRILPFEEQIITGRKTVRTNVTSPAVARVVVALDGKEVSSIARPPFSANVSFSAIPEARVVRAIAYDSQGAEVGRDELTVNDAGELFWIRLAEPRSGAVSGAVPVAMTLRAPASRSVRRVTVSWNDKPAAVLTAPPWRAVVNIPAGEIGVLQAVADLDDGRAAEDAVALNTTTFAERAEVQLVELPVTVTGRGGEPVKALDAKSVSVREGRTRRTVESVVVGTEAPLTVGILLDTSASMQKALPDLQEAAIRFLDSVLETNDRAFLISFDTRATLLQAATSDRAVLRQKIMGLRPSGMTALHDAMVLGLMQFEGVKGRRGLVVFTDGLDRTSRYSAADLGRLAQRSNLPIHLITTPLNRVMIPPQIPQAQAGRPVPRTTAPMQVTTSSRAATDLTNVARSSGGRLHEISRLDALGKIYSEIATDLRAQVLVTIRTEPGTGENEWREVEVKVASRDLDVRAPAGYFAPH